MSTSDFTPQPLPDWQRAVLKIGSSLLASDGRLNDRHVQALARFIADAMAHGREVVLVSSGSVAAGRGWINDDGDDGVVLRQALAALGQASLVGFWQKLVHVPVAQVLLSHDDLHNRRRYLNARATLRELSRLHVLPIVNENDTVAVDELKLGDNDNLAAAVASLVEADLLLIATDIEGLYSANPHRDPDARPIEHVEQVTPELMRAAGGDAGELGTGGMRTKLEAASKAASAGIATALFCGRDKQVVEALSHDELRGTLFSADDDRLDARKQWLHHAPGVGSVVVDDGAVDALHGSGASLLPGGVLRVEGDFRRDDMIEVIADGGEAPLGRGLAQYSADEIRRIARRRSHDIESILGFCHGESVIHRDDLVLLPHGDRA